MMASATRPGPIVLVKDFATASIPAGGLALAAQSVLLPPSVIGLWHVRQICRVFVTNTASTTAAITVGVTSDYPSGAVGFNDEYVYPITTSLVGRCLTSWVDGIISDGQSGVFYQNLYASQAGLTLQAVDESSNQISKCLLVCTPL